MSTWAANINSFDTQALVLNTKPNTSLIGGKTLSKEEAQEAAQDFEAFFMTKMMESMFMTVFCTFGVSVIPWKNE